MSGHECPGDGCRICEYRIAAEEWERGTEEEVDDFAIEAAANREVNR